MHASPNGKVAKAFNVVSPREWLTDWQARAPFALPASILATALRSSKPRADRNAMTNGPVHCVPNNMHWGFPYWGFVYWGFSA